MREQYGAWQEGQGSKEVRASSRTIVSCEPCFPPVQYWKGCLRRVQMGRGPLCTRCTGDTGCTDRAGSYRFVRYAAQSCAFDAFWDALMLTSGQLPQYALSNMSRSSLRRRATCPVPSVRRATPVALSPAAGPLPPPPPSARLAASESSCSGQADGQTNEASKRWLD